METRARRRIRQAVESRGYQLMTLEWEPWSPGGEKEGINGGWYGTLDRNYQPLTLPGNEIMGLSVDEVLAWIDDFVKPPDPCDCPPRTGYGYAERNLHLVGCRWHIRYRLPWWTP